MRLWWKICGSALLVSLSAAAVMVPAQAATTGTKLKGGIGNAEGGKLVKLAKGVAKKTLVGPKGTGLTNGVTKSSVTIGCVTTPAEYPLFQQGIQGAFDVANAHGGVNGRKLHLVTCSNDNATVQTDVNDAEKLVTETHVFAELSLSDVFLPGATNFLNAHQVPFLGWGFNPGFCGTRWGFGWNGCLGGNAIPGPLQVIAGNLVAAVYTATGIKPKGAKIAIQSETGAAGHIGLAQFTALAKALKNTIVYAEANMPLSGTVDMTPYVSAILAGHPQVILAAAAFSELGPFVSALRAGGFTGPIYDYSAYIPGLLAATKSLASALDQEYIDTQVVPQEQGTPYIHQEKAALQAVGAKATTVTLGASMGYAEGTMLIEMLKAVGKNLNTKTFDQKINNGTFVAYRGLKGGPGQIHWPAAHYLPADCSSMVQVTGTIYKVAVPFKCYQSFQVVKGS